jgi:hypothetical protein
MYEDGVDETRDFGRNVADWRLEDVLRDVRFKGYDAIHISRNPPEENVRYNHPVPRSAGKQVWVGST